MAESISGFHFLSEYRKCPRRFMLKYVYHLVPEYKSPALLFGIAIHEALARWAVTQDIDSALFELDHSIMMSMINYADRTQAEKDLQRGTVMIKKYIETWEEVDKEKYKVLAAELGFEVKLANQFKFTGRVDTVVKEKDTGNVYILEHKTTGYSLGAAAHNVMIGDQATAYLFGLQKAKPSWKVIGVIPDILYNRQSVVKCERFTPVLRTQLGLKEFELGIMGTLIEISQKVQSLEKYPWPFVFPRNCDAAIFKCEYEDICRIRIESDKVPIGFKKEKESEKIINDLVDVDTVKFTCKR